MSQVYLGYLCLPDTTLKNALMKIACSVECSQRTTGSDVFEVENDYITSEDISWSNCIGIKTDGAAVFTGHKKDFQDEVRQIARHVNFIHCIIHREGLASRDLQPQLHTVLEETVKVVNSVKARPLNSRLFALFC
jgi:hypothetical protein